MNMPFIMAALLALMLLGSSVSLVYAKHISRVLFTESQMLVSERDRIDIEWRRLQLEHASLATHARVERLARSHLKMRVPTVDSIVMVRP